MAFAEVHVPHGRVELCDFLFVQLAGTLTRPHLGLGHDLVGPFAAKVKTVVEEDAHFSKLIREVLVANLHRHTPNICIEVGRQNTPHHIRPSFSELEEALRSVKADAA